MKKEQSEYEKEMNSEIEDRLCQLEKEGLDSGKRFGITDWVFVAVIVLAGLVITLIGGGLK